jgi:hypothetical protein
MHFPTGLTPLTQLRVGLGYALANPSQPSPPDSGGEGRVRGPPFSPIRFDRKLV